MTFNNMHTSRIAGLGFARKGRFAMEVPGGSPPHPAGPNEYAQQPPAHYAQGPARKKRHRAAAVAIVVILVVLALAFAFNYSSAHGKGWFGSSAEIYINVNNLNPDDTITATITVNGQEVGEKTLTDGNDWTLTFKPFFFGNNDTFNIILTVDGSVLSDGEHEISVTVEQGETTNVPFIVI